MITTNEQTRLEDNLLSREGDFHRNSWDGERRREGAEEKYSRRFWPLLWPERWNLCLTIATLVVLIFGLNLVLLLNHGQLFGLRTSSGLCYSDKTRYSGLRRDILKELKYLSPYWSDNETLSSELWNQLEIHTGFVALNKEWTDGKGLPRGDSFPWDDSKTIYVLNVFHILHCLQMFRTSIVEAHHNLPQSMSYKHLQHCLNDLREDAMCNADDTPRYTHPWPDRVTGADGQLRQCRDFRALSSWAYSNTACFRFSHRDDPTWNKTARFRHCPPDSPYLPLIREYYGFRDDWQPNEGITPSWSHLADNQHLR